MSCQVDIDIGFVSSKESLLVSGIRKCARPARSARTSSWHDSRVPNMQNANAKFVASVFPVDVLYGRTCGVLVSLLNILENVALHVHWLSWPFIETHLCPSAQTSLEDLQLPPKVQQPKTHRDGQARLIG